jgi:hypothetical protein
MKFYLLTFLFFLALSSVYSQQRDTVISKQNVEILSILKNIKIQGFIQTQYQWIDTPGASCLSGGDFEINSNNRFSVCRARLITTFRTDLSEYLIHIKATEKGVGLAEAYMSITDPWFKSIKLKSGIFDRPFGNEIGYSAMLQESDERSRVIKYLFPDEKDLGIMLSLSPPKDSKFSFLHFDAGVFNGTGPDHSDFDSRKDFICHFYMQQNLFHEKFKLGLGVSMYNGGFSNQRNEHFEWDNGFISKPNDLFALSERNIKGIDTQLSYKWFLGETKIRAEYIYGIQSGTPESSKTPYVAPVDSKGNPLPSYIRNCTGGYAIFMHDIANTNLQLVCKYDWYDPNSKTKGIEIGQLPNTGAADIQYTTWGFGFNYQFSKSLKFLTYYNIIENEKTSIPNYTTDLKDNFYTFRLQYVF